MYGIENALWNAGGQGTDGQEDQIIASTVSFFEAERWSHQRPQTRNTSHFSAPEGSAGKFVPCLVLSAQRRFSGLRERGQQGAKWGRIGQGGVTLTACGGLHRLVASDMVRCCTRLKGSRLRLMHPRLFWECSRHLLLSFLGWIYTFPDRLKRRAKARKPSPC